MRGLFILIFLAACGAFPPRIAEEDKPIAAQPAIPIPDEEAAIKRRKPASPPPPKVVIKEGTTAPVLLPPCPPETGDKMKDMLRLLNCVIETADKPIPPADTKK